jgi:hypothetical protein
VAGEDHECGLPGALPDEGGLRGALPADQRPLDHTPVHTADLPATPIRDRNIPATAWVEAPPELLALGADLPDAPVATYKRRIGRWLLWRAGPASRGDARYLACDARDLAEQWTFRLFPDGSGRGDGPDGTVHTRFRTWKEALLARSQAGPEDHDGGHADHFHYPDSGK